MNAISTMILLLVAVLISAGVAHASELPEIEGVFGLDNITDQTCLAVWVPLEEGTVISGVRWYQNDGDTVFPEILAQGGILEWPSSISDAIVLGQNVGGETSAWSEIEFQQPITADCDGLYLYFRLPEGAIFKNNGIDGGFGLGYYEGNGVRNSWLTGNNQDWNPMAPTYQMAVEPILGTNKSSSDVLVLHLPGGSEIDSSEPENQMLEPLTASLLAYPNPFNPQTEIKFVVQKTGPVSLRVFDIRGRLVSELVGQHLQEGEHSVTWDGRNYSGRQVASGVYFARLEIGSIVLSRQLVLLK